VTACGAAAGGQDPEPPGVHPSAARAAQPGSWRDYSRPAPATCGARPRVGAVEDQIRWGRGRAEQIRQEAPPGPQLGAAVGTRPHDLGVDAEGGVVDEHPVVDPTEIDGALDAVGERIQGAEQVAAVEAEVEREVLRVPERMQAYAMPWPA
jgi:hypothetical protein